MSSNHHCAEGCGKASESDCPIRERGECPESTQNEWACPVCGYKNVMGTTCTRCATLSHGAALNHLCYRTDERDLARARVDDLNEALESVLAQLDEAGIQWTRVSDTNAIAVNLPHKKEDK